MKFSVECLVDATTKISDIIKVSHSGREYEFYPNDSGRLGKIKIIEKVPEPSKFYSKFGKGDGTIKHTLTINADKEVYNLLIKEFQLLEASLTLNGVKRIRWDQPKVEYLPETPEEVTKTEVLGVEHKEEYPEVEPELNKGDLDKIVQSMGDYEELLVLDAFLREGLNEFKQFRYINSFYNFYFVIEDLYGGGKTKNDQIEKSLKNSKEFSEILKDILEQQITTNEKHKNNLLKFLNERNLENSIEGVIKLIVSTRGILHHFSRKNRLRQGNPLNQRDFETMAFLVFGLALNGILRRVVEINNRKKPNE